MILNLIDTDNRFRPRRDQQANGATDISSGAQRPRWLQRDDDINDFAVLLGRLDNRLEEGRHGCIIGGKMRGRMITGEPHDFATPAISASPLGTAEGVGASRSLCARSTSQYAGIPVAPAA